MGRTFALSFERLEPATPTDALSISLLMKAAWFAPGEPIPRSLLLQSAGIDSLDPLSALDGKDSLRRLTDLGLLEANEQNDLPRVRFTSAASGLERKL
ncbi:MAG: hypothetical protein ABUT39_24890 [Acidobacteriota bacterium]